MKRIKVLTQDGEIWVLVLSRAPKCQLGRPLDYALSLILQIRVKPAEIQSPAPGFLDMRGLQLFGDRSGEASKERRVEQAAFCSRRLQSTPVRSRPGVPHANGLSACKPGHPLAYLAGLGDLFGTAPKLRRITARRPVTFPAGARPEAARDEEKKPASHGEALPNLGRQDQFGGPLKSLRLGPPPFLLGATCFSSLAALRDSAGFGRPLVLCAFPTV